MARATVATTNVAELQEIFPQSFAVYGTALGSLREQNVIEHDSDTDIGILEENFKWEGVTEAIRRGFGIIAVFGMRHYGMEIAFRRDGIKTDLMLFYRSPDNPVKRFNCLWDNGGRNGISDAIVHEYDEQLLEPIEGQLGVERIKTLSEKYVEAVYGKDWQVPVKKWDWRTDHLCKKTG